MSVEVYEDSLFANFERYQEFKNIQTALLSVDLFRDPNPDEQGEEGVQFKKLFDILDQYQEQSYLLDPFLEQLVEPVVEQLKSHAKASILNPNRIPSSTRVWNLSQLLYRYIKCRGYKTIIRFFPHEIADLTVALEYLHPPGGTSQSPSRWSLHYIVLLWLSLICMIPFDLSQFDEPDSIGKTASTLESLARDFLDKAGLERDGAALLLSRLYMRKDVGSRFHDFVHSSNAFFQTQTQVFTALGILQVLSEVIKSGPPRQVKDELENIMNLAALIDESESLTKNTLIRKFKTKILSRIALRILPNNPHAGQRRGRTLAGDVIGPQQIHVLEGDVPEEVEIILEKLFESLQDKDTIVRWSTAKGIARIAERLPTDFADQILETILGLFSIHSIAAASLYDLPAVAESTWHGACLACAEMARRNLVAASHMSQLIEWLSKALHFDIRKGAHSIGSNVRDAASYVLWALARTQDISTLQPHANNLANRLASVAIYDREIHIRRAASAAFQEHVGRTNLFPHGIDVLGKTDFYSVSVRKHAYLEAAPQVAEHLEYRLFLLKHVLDVVLRHWDSSIRELGSQSLRNLCLIDLEGMVPEAFTKLVPLLESIDPTDVHGALLALTEIGVAYRQSSLEKNLLNKHLRNVFHYIGRVSQDVLQPPRNYLVTAAACRLIATTLTVEEIQVHQDSSRPHWRQIVDLGIQHRNSVVQDAAAEAVGALSKLTDCSNYELRAGSSSSQQSLAKVLGALDYHTSPQILPKSIAFLLDGVKPSQKRTIETRRGCYVSIPLVITNIVPSSIELMSVETIDTLLDTLLNGLHDYTIDERGDVGSWIRIASIRGLTSACTLLLRNAGQIPNFESWLPPSIFHSIFSAILKQGVERLDNVRHEAGKACLQLLELPIPSVDSGERWVLPGLEVLQELLLNNPEEKDWSDGNWLFPRAVRLLGISAYQRDILSGIILSIASKTDSTQRPMALALPQYIESLPLTQDGSGYNLLAFVDELLERVSSNITSNTVVVPVFQTFNVLLEAEALRNLVDDPAGLQRLQTLSTLATKNVAKWKSVQRIQEAMKIFVALLGIPVLRSKNATSISDFLAHTYPKIRSETAEHLYLQIETVDFGIEDTNEIESILLETTWTTLDIPEAKTASNEIVNILSRTVHTS